MTLKAIFDWHFRSLKIATIMTGSNRQAATCI